MQRYYTLRRRRSIPPWSLKIRDALVFHGPLCVRDLAGHIGRTEPRVSEALAALEEAGLVRRYSVGKRRMACLASFWPDNALVGRPLTYSYRSGSVPIRA